MNTDNQPLSRLDQRGGRTCRRLRFFKRRNPTFKTVDHFGKSSQNADVESEASDYLCAQVGQGAAAGLEFLESSLATLRLLPEQIGQFSHDDSPCSRCGAPSVGASTGRGTGATAPAGQGQA